MRTQKFFSLYNDAFTVVGNSGGDVWNESIENYHVVPTPYVTH